MQGLRVCADRHADEDHRGALGAIIIDYEASHDSPPGTLGGVSRRQACVGPGARSRVA